MPANKDIDYTKTNETEAKKATLDGVYYCHDKNYNFLADFDDEDVQDLYFDVQKEMKNRELNLYEFLTPEERLYYEMTEDQIMKTIIREAFNYKLEKSNHDVDLLVEQMRESTDNVKRETPNAGRLTVEIVMENKDLLPPATPIITDGGELEFVRVLATHMQKIIDDYNTYGLAKLDNILAEELDFKTQIKEKFQELQTKLLAGKNALRAKMRASGVRRHAGGGGGALPGGRGGL